MNTADLWAHTDAQAVAVLREAFTAKQVAEAAFLAAAADLDLRPGAIPSYAGREAHLFIRHALLRTDRQAKADVLAARSLSRNQSEVLALPLMGEALGAGEISREHVDVAAKIGEEIPKAVLAREVPDLGPDFSGDLAVFAAQAASDPDSVTWISVAVAIDRYFAHISRRHNPGDCARLGKSLLQALKENDGDGFDPDSVARRRENHHRDDDGNLIGEFVLDPVAAAVFAQAIDHFSKPDPTREETTPDGQKVKVKDGRTPTQRRADALVKMAAAALSSAQAGTAKGGERPHIVIHCGLDDLHDTHCDGTHQQHEQPGQQQDPQQEPERDHDHQRDHDQRQHEPHDHEQHKNDQDEDDQHEDDLGEQDEEQEQQQEEDEPAEQSSEQPEWPEHEQRDSDAKHASSGPVEPGPPDPPEPPDPSGPTEPLNSPDSPEPPHSPEPPESPDAQSPTLENSTPAPLLRPQMMYGAHHHHLGYLSPHLLARFSCDAVLQAVLLNRAGAVLDLGRTARTINRHQRRALNARDRGCVIPGCTALPEWTEGHHVQWWEHDGPTDMINLALLCSRHHTDVHLGIWELRMIDGVPWARPPRWIDRQQRWLRNTLHHDDDNARKLGTQLRLNLPENLPWRTPDMPTRKRPLPLTPADPSSEPPPPPSPPPPSPQPSPQPQPQPHDPDGDVFPPSRS